MSSIKSFCEPLKIAEFDHDGVLDGDNFLLQPRRLVPEQALALLQGLVPPHHDGLVGSEDRKFSSRVTQPLIRLASLHRLEALLVLGELRLGPLEVVLQGPLIHQG